MGRTKGFKKDRMYITHSEWVTEWGGKREGRERRAFKALQYTHCNLSLQPWTDPVCTRDGTIYELTNIMQWLKKHGVDPVTGQPLKAGDLVPLNFTPAPEGGFMCPISFKEFTDYTHIVAIKNTGNVYSWSVVNDHNIQRKNMKDLLSNEPFTKADIITIQDPADPNKGNVQMFYHVQQGLTDSIKPKSDDPTANISASSISSLVFKEMKVRQDEKSRQMQLEANEAQETGPYVVVKETVRPAVAAASFTSSSYQSKLETKLHFPDGNCVLVSSPVKKTSKIGLVQLCTNFGNLNFEIFANQTPLAAENFIVKCEQGDYDGVIFHRNIPGFMIQGGDPTGTGKGGESIWKVDFPDEIVPTLKHDKRGVLSMANRGPTTNSCQFFITYQETPHLDGLHTIFGQLVGGEEVLKLMETVATDEDDRPVHPVVIAKTKVFQNPFSPEAMKEEAAEVAQAKRREDEKTEFGQWLSNPGQAMKNANSNAPSKASSKIGKYVVSSSSVPPSSSSATKREGSTINSNRPTKRSKSSYGNFSNF